jgi:aromatic ring hydroxylase
MTIKLEGIQIEIPGDAQVDVSEDGKKVTIRVPEPTETIRVVESESETIIIHGNRLILHQHHLIILHQLRGQ